MDNSGLEALGALEDEALHEPAPEPARSLWDRVTALPDQAVALWHGAGDVRRAGWTEWRESDHKLRTLAVSAGALALQASERVRIISTIILPPVAFDVLQTTSNPFEAAAAGALAYAGWWAMVGAVTTEAIDHHPKAVAKFAENFPRAIRLAAAIGKTLPGLHPSAPAAEDASRSARFRSRLGTGLKRGYTVPGMGITAYVAAAAADRMTRKEIHKLSLNASADGGAAIGGILLLASGLIVELAHSDPALAEQIQHDAQNKKYWTMLAGALMVRQLVANKIKSARDAKREKQSEETPQLNKS